MQLEPANLGGWWRNTAKRLLHGSFGIPTKKSTLVFVETQSSCSELKSQHSSLKNGHYFIDPDGEGGDDPFHVFCDMSDKAGVGVTVVSHDSETRTLVRWSAGAHGRYYEHDVTYTLVNWTQLISLTTVSSHCEQFIKYECYHAKLSREGNLSSLVSRDVTRMNYWGGAFPGSNQCACGMNKTCVQNNHCNCDADDFSWREDSGFLTHKSDLPVSKLMFWRLRRYLRKAYHTLGKLMCYGTEKCLSNPCLNGGTCTPLTGNTYVCRCAVGFTGSRCETGQFINRQSITFLASKTCNSFRRN